MSLMFFYVLDTNKQAILCFIAKYTKIRIGGHGLCNLKKTNNFSNQKICTAVISEMCVSSQ